MKKKRSTVLTVLINLLFLAAIAVVGWKIYDYTNDNRQTVRLAEKLWAEAVLTAPPSRETASPARVTMGNPAYMACKMTVAKP